MKLYIYIIIIFLVSCKKPNDPITTDHIASFVAHLDTYGEALDTDLTSDNMVVAANYQGFIVYDLERNDQGHIIAIDSIYNDSDMDPSMGDNRAQEIVISQNHNIAFITDIYDRIWLYKLGENSLQYADNYLEDCVGGTWLSTAIDDQSDHINVFSLVKHISSESDADTTVGDFDEYSTSVVWKGLYDVNPEDLLPEDNAFPSCEFSYNFGVLPEKIDFNNGLLAVSNGELGVKVLKQSDQIGCFDNQGQLIEEFDPIEEYDCDFSGENNKNVCEANPWDDFDGDYYPDCPDGFNGAYVSVGGFYPYVYSSFDMPGEINSLLVRNSVIFTGLSTSNGCYMSLLDSSGVVVDNLSLANGYTINSISEDNGIIALSAGHDGALLYRHYQNFDDENDLLGPVSFIGQIDVPYSNNVRVDGDNLIISTEDGIYLYLIK